MFMFLSCMRIRFTSLSVSQSNANTYVSLIFKMSCRKHCCYSLNKKVHLEGRVGELCGDAQPVRRCLGGSRVSGWATMKERVHGDTEVR